MTNEERDRVRRWVAHLRAQEDGVLLETCGVCREIAAEFDLTTSTRAERDRIMDARRRDDRMERERIGAQARYTTQPPEWQAAVVDPAAVVEPAGQALASGTRGRFRGNGISDIIREGSQVSEELGPGDTVLSPPTEDYR